MAPQLQQVTFEPSLPILISLITTRKYAAICGANNSGKSYILKRLKQHVGRTAYLAGSARFYHVHTLSSSARLVREYDQYENNFNMNVNNTEYNFDQNTIALDRILANMPDSRRDKLFSICETLIGNKFSLKNFEEDNRMSAFYVDMDGQNFAIGSSGTRLLMTLLGLCMDENFNSLYIDEPELGLGPRIQLRLGKLFSDSEERRKYFPHLSSIVVATHSNLFLDTSDINSNFSVEKVACNILIRQVQNFSELHNLQFNLLGNSLESLFLPGGFIVVEGKTDLPYVDKLVKLYTKDHNVVVIQSNGDVKGRVHSLREALHDISRSPFRTRIFAVLDSVVPNPSLKQQLVAMGLVSENIIQWSANGVEYLYPSSVLARIFSCAESRVGELSINGDDVSLNGITKRKVELSALVCEQLTVETPLPAEVSEKLISKLLSLT